MSTEEEDRKRFGERTKRGWGEPGSERHERRAQIVRESHRTPQARENARRGAETAKILKENRKKLKRQKQSPDR